MGTRQRAGRFFAMDNRTSSLSDSGTAFENVPMDNKPRGAGAGIEKGAYDDSKVPFMTARTFFMCILVSMGGICFEYDTGQISGFLEMENFLYNFADQREPTLAFTWRRSGLIVGMLSIGTLFGALISAPIANHPKIGRRLSIFGWCMIFIVGNIIQIAAEYPKWYEMMVGRIVAGLAIGGLSVLVPMYQGESSPAHIRGAIVCCYQLFITIGILLANLINFGTESISNTGSWRIPIGISFAWALILAFGILLFPETPRFDFRNGNIDKARKNIAKFHGVSENHRVVRDMMLDLEEKLAGCRDSSVPAIDWCQLLLLLRNHHLLLNRDRQLLHHSNHPRLRQCRLHLPWSLHGREIRSSQMSHYRCPLDVHVLPRLCLAG